MNLKLLIDRIKSNWQAGLTVSLVSIPLSVSLAVASQTSPVVGIITAIWAGLIAAIFGGSKFNIVGPTGALSGILASYAIAHGAPSLALLAIVTGVFIMLAYFFKLERYLVFVPSSTIHGFTLGVAFIIALNQANFALGINNLEKHEKFVSNLYETATHLYLTSMPTLAIFLIFLIGLFVLTKLIPKIPGAIILTPIGILLGYLSTNKMIPLSLDTLQTKFGDIQATLFIMPTFQFERSLFIAAFTVALIAILETMISAKIADGMTKTKYNRRKEMFGLGLANIVTGLMGGIPATAALARTSLNVKSGANHNMSAIISSVSIALISIVLLQYFKFIPLSVIAAILVFVAIRMVEREHFTRYYKYDRKGFILAMLVAFITVYEDPIIGILFGTAVSLILFVDDLSRGQYELMVNSPQFKQAKHVSHEELDKLKGSEHVLVYSIRGVLGYMNSQAHIARFEEPLSSYHSVILRMREVAFMDLDGIEALNEIIGILYEKEKYVYITGVNPAVEQILKRESAIYRELKKLGAVLPKTTDALEVALKNK
ncbi:MAG: SulP family inorganic anion transporter [Weeksellaceae bacterium]